MKNELFVPKLTKARLFTHRCHKINRIEAVGLSLSNYSFKIIIVVISKLWGKVREKIIFVNNRLIKVRI